jgi:hypothetical protein
MFGDLRRLFRPKPLTPNEERELLETALVSVVIGTVVSTAVFVRLDLLAFGWFGVAIAFFLLSAVGSALCAGWLLLLKPFLGYLSAIDAKSR